MTRPLAVLFALCSSTLAAQQQPLVGTWKVSYAVETRVQNGEASVVMGSGVLTIAADRDSLIGNLVTDPIPDSPQRPPVRLAAKNGDGEIPFTSRSTATLNLNGNERQATVVSTWTLRATGDSLSGMLARKLEGFNAPPPPPQPLSGTRRKG